MSLSQNKKRRVKERDGNRCADCGTDERLTVHHVKAVADGGHPTNLKNLTTLCWPCHERRHPA